MVANRPDTITEEKFYKQIFAYSTLVVVVGSRAGVGRGRRFRMGVSTVPHDHD